MVLLPDDFIETTLPVASEILFFRKFTVASTLASTGREIVTYSGKINVPRFSFIVTGSGIMAIVEFFCPKTENESAMMKMVRIVFFMII